MKRLIGKILGLASLGGILCFVLFGTVAKAAVALPAGGEDFGTAVTIDPGSYVTDREIAQNSYEFFKTSVASGQSLTVSVTTPSGEYPYAGVRVYDSEQTEVSSQEIIGDAVEAETVTWVPSAEDAGVFYIAVGSAYDVNASGTTYAVSVDDHFDAGGKSDAGGTFGTAMVLTAAGTYQGYIVTDEHGTDLIDFYRLQFEKGAEVTVTVTPSEADARLDLAVYNPNQEELATGSSPSDGARATASLSEALESDTVLYIKVDATYWLAENPIDYTLKIATAKVGIADGEGEEDTTAGEGGSTTTGGGEGAEGGPNWTLIGAGAVLLILIGVVAFAFLARRRKTPHSTSAPSAHGRPGSEETPPSQKEETPPAEGAES